MPAGLRGVAMLFRLGLLVFLLLPGWAMAEIRSVQPTDALPGHADKTYLDLIGMVVPDIELVDGGYKGTALLPMHHIGGEDADPPDITTLGPISSLDVKSEGKPRVALLFDLGQSPDAAESFSVLALYDIVGAPRLLAAVGVGLDRFTSLYEPAVMPVSAANDVIVTASTHFNSNQSYMITAMILVRDDLLQLVDYVFTLDERACAYERRQVPTYTARPGAALFADIHASVKDTITPSDADCGEEAKEDAVERAVTTIYRWDQSLEKYAPDGDDLERLQEENRERL